MHLFTLHTSPWCWKYNTEWPTKNLHDHADACLILFVLIDCHVVIFVCWNHPPRWSISAVIDTRGRDSKLPNLIRNCINGHASLYTRCRKQGHPIKTKMMYSQRLDHFLSIGISKHIAVFIFNSIIGFYLDLIRNYLKYCTSLVWPK